jgi:hypothetical protein
MFRRVSAGIVGAHSHVQRVYQGIREDSARRTRHGVAPWRQLLQLGRAGHCGIVDCESRKSGVTTLNSDLAAAVGATGGLWGILMCYVELAISWPRQEESTSQTGGMEQEEKDAGMGS